MRPLDLGPNGPPLLLVVGSGGVGKTTLAAALGLLSAQAGRETLVMTFDPSHRLKDTLGVGDAARDRIVPVAAETPVGLHASLLDARATFDRLVASHAPDDGARDRILGNRYYDHLAGSLAGILEYMAVERLYEVWEEGRFDRIILDTPPTGEALDFLEAPARIVSFLDSGAIRIALRPWFDAEGHLKPLRRIPGLGRSLEGWLDRVVGLGLLRDMAEFFQAFAPLFDGFRARAQRVEELLSSEAARFVLVSGPDEDRVPDTLFFARRLQESGYSLGPTLVNRIHPVVAGARLPDPGRPEAADGRQVLAWQADRDLRGLRAMRSLLPAGAVTSIPLLDREPNDLQGLREVGETLRKGLAVIDFDAAVR